MKSEQPMPPSTMARRPLDAAELLLNEGWRRGAFRRRAVSTAYHAVFHALAKVSADFLTRSAPRGTEPYERVYQSLGHTLLKEAFKQPPMRDNQTLSRIGTAVEKLQIAREDADYLPSMPRTVTAQGAQELLDQARATVGEIERLKPASEEYRMLAIYLTIPKRRSKTP